MPISVLLVEDDDTKAERIERVIRDQCAELEPDLRRVKCANDALTCLRQGEFDLMVLDLQLPMRLDSRAPKKSAGVRVLRSLRKDSSLRAASHIVGLTGFPELMSKYEDEFGAELWSLLHYDPGQEDWAERLGARVLHILQSKSGTNGAPTDVDLFVLTALQNPELSAVLSLPGAWAEHRVDSDPTVYHRCVWEGESSRLRVCAAASSGMGPSAAAVLATKAILAFRPRYLVLCGIAAGIGSDFGDLVIAERSWDYSRGKVVASEGTGLELLKEPDTVAACEGVLGRLRWFAESRSLLQGIASGYSGEKPKEIPDVHFGPMACGPLVVAARTLVEEFKKDNRKVIGLDMESYSVLLASRTACVPPTRAFVVKGVSDRADAEKDDKWRAYAAWNSARFVYQFGLEQLAGVRSGD